MHLRKASKVVEAFFSEFVGLGSIRVEFCSKQTPQQRFSGMGFTRKLFFYISQSFLQDPHSYSNKVTGLQYIDCNFTENEVFHKNI